MSRSRPFTCPTCGERFPVYTVGGMAGLTALPCDSCAEVIWVVPPDKLLAWPYRVLLLPPFFFLIPLLEFFGVMGNPHTRKYFERVTEHYPACECGGRFRHDAPNHCPKCRAPLPVDELKRQLNWPSEYRPVVYITRFREV